MRLISTLQLQLNILMMIISQISRIYSYVSPRSSAIMQRYRYMLQSKNTHHNIPHNIPRYNNIHRLSYNRNYVHHILPCYIHHQQNYTPIKPISITQLFSSTTADDESTTDKEKVDLDPYDILRDLQNIQNKDTDDDDVSIPYPTHYSPTSLETFKKCPQAFFFLYILKLTQDQPMTEALARGIICHTALEEVFDLKPQERTLDNLENLFRRGWSKVRGDRGSKEDTNETNKEKENKYDVLFRDEEGSGAADIEKEIEWGKSSLDLLRSYYELEDPKTITTPNPVVNEMWVNARIPISPTDNKDERIELKGKIDRIDVLPNDNSVDEKVQLQILDYKTGKKPWFKYSKKFNDKIRDEAFWKMKVYAMMLSKMIQQTDQASQLTIDEQKEQYKYSMSWNLKQRLEHAMRNVQSNPKWSNIIELNSLRLMYLTSNIEDDSVNDPNTTQEDGIGKATCLDLSLGSSPQEIDSLLDEVEIEVQSIVKDILILVDQQDPTAFKHCDWRYCSCHELRRRFHPGSVYQSPDMEM